MAGDERGQCTHTNTVRPDCSVRSCNVHGMGKVVEDPGRDPIRTGGGALAEGSQIGSTSNQERVWKVKYILQRALGCQGHGGGTSETLTPS